MRTISFILSIPIAYSFTTEGSVCGDGVCRSPEYDGNCPSDCGEQLRNPRLARPDSTDQAPYFWKLVEDTITQPGIRLVPGQQYRLTGATDRPECAELFVHTPTEVLASGVLSEFFGPEDSEQEFFVSLRWVCAEILENLHVSLKPVAEARGAAFKWSHVQDSMIGNSLENVAWEECRQLCIQKAACFAWETCPGSKAEGCGGCYLFGRVPEVADAVEFKADWAAAIERSSETSEARISAGKCRAFLLAQSAHESGFYEDKIQQYNDCGGLLRSDVAIPKQIFVGGVHFPTLIVANHRSPSLVFNGEGGASKLPVTNHFFALPFYDTNIGNVIKSTGAMNIIQAYEMQSLTAVGGVYVDVGANLGSYVVPMAEHVGPAGLVVAFEPFRWLFQLLNANVALNGLMNVHAFNLALTDEPLRHMLLQPMLRFYSSPGGVRVNNQTGGLDDNTKNQLYDNEWGQEAVDAWPLDDILTDEWFAGKNRAPRLDLIKIDVEGLEQDVIRGARNLITRFRPVVWSENVDYFEKGDNSFIELMAELDYSCGKAENAPNDLICKSNAL